MIIVFKKVHNKIYKVPHFFKFIYVVMLSFATIDYFAEGNRNMWSVFIFIIMTIFNYWLIIEPGKRE